MPLPDNCQELKVFYLRNKWSQVKPSMKTDKMMAKMEKLLFYQKGVRVDYMKDNDLASNSSAPYI